jgi:hypothetical protein
LNNNLKIFIVAILFFGLGVWVTKYLSPDNFEAAVTPRQKELQKIAIEAQHRPFFMQTKDVADQPINSSIEKNVDSPFKAQDDYFKVLAKLNQFTIKITDELNKKFKILGFSKKSLSDERKKQHLKNSLEYMFSQNELWYSAIFTDTASGGKFYLFFNYYPCDNKAPRSVMKLNEICYSLNFNIIKNNKWIVTSAGEPTAFLYWKNDSPYAHIMFDGRGEMNEATKAVLALVSIPNENYPIEFLQFNSGEFSWRPSDEMKWRLSSKAENKKFIDWAEAEGFKNSDGYN